MTSDISLDQASLFSRGFRAIRDHIALVSTMPILAVVIWLGVSGRSTRDEARLASQQAMRVVELRGTIAYLDEWLVMSARMAASSGETRWRDRYEEAVPKLDAAIAEAGELATPAAKAAFTETTGEAHRDLATMERRALALASNGDLAAARALLNSAEFSYLQDVYAGGIDLFGEQLKALSDRRTADLDRRAWLEGVALALSAILLIATILSIRGHVRLQGALARTAAVARTDALTGLPNRRWLYEHLDATLVRGAKAGLDYALMLIALDRFKAINDAYSHTAGDELLRLVATRLRNAFPEEQYLARLGGDEFALVMRCDQGAVEPRGDVSKVAKQVGELLREPFSLTEVAIVQIGASVGIGLMHAGRPSVDEVLHQADVALYRAKADGRGCFRVFEPGMDEPIRARALLEGDLRQAIADEAIEPHFQPLVDLQSGRCIGVEMLARWRHPIGGMIPPTEFIPMAEDLGLIGIMTEQLLRIGCRAATSWPTDITLACNISPIQLRDPDLPVMIRAILEETGLPPHQLEVEVTESAFVGDLDLARTLLNQLKLLGVRLALDDFGTGYSSLRHLQTLPFDKIKIDRSFVSNVTQDPESCKIVAAVLSLGRSLGLTTTAEGVETPDTAALLRDLGCNIGQGWLFGRPVGAEQIDFLNCKPGYGDGTSTLAA